MDESAALCFNVFIKPCPRCRAIAEMFKRRSVSGNSREEERSPLPRAKHDFGMARGEVRTT
jgi:hypothetical protein